MSETHAVSVFDGPVILTLVSILYKYPMLSASIWPAAKY